MAADQPLQPQLDRFSTTPSAWEERRQQRLKECLDRLAEAEALLTGVRRAEQAVSSARQALTELSGEASPPCDVVCPSAEAPAPQKESSAGDGVIVKDEPSKDTVPNADFCILDQAVMDTICNDHKTEEAEGGVQRPSIQRALTFMMPKRAGSKSSSLASARGWTAAHMRRGWISKPCCCGITVPIFFPDCKFALGWDLLGLVFIIFETFALPVNLAFEISATGFFMWIVSLVNVYFIVDIPLNFARGFKGNAGFIVVSPELIARRYVKWVTFDILAGIPWEWLEPYMDPHHSRWAQCTKMLRLLRVARLLRLLRLQILPDRVKMYVESNSWLTFIEGVIRVLFCLFSITHWAACIWFYIGSKSDDQNTWIAAHLPADADFSTKYMYSLYFTLTTMTTVGYGDITPQNNDEVLFTLILLLVATVVFATLMGALTDLICSLQSEKHQEDTRVRMLSHYMNWRQVPKDLFKAVRKHMLFIWDTNKGYDAYEHEVKDSLPPVLRRELSYHVYGRVLRSAPFLAWLWDYEVCLKELALSVHSMILSRGDQLFRSGQPNNKMFILQSGFVRISLNERLFSFKLNDGDADDDEAEDEHDELEKVRMDDVVHALRLPGRSESLIHHIPEVKLGGSSTKHNSQDVFNSKVLWTAVEQLQQQDLRMAWAARHIQRRWQKKRIQRQKATRRAKAPLIRSRTVAAPCYFGEACLWEPFDAWSQDEAMSHKYSACCESICEVIIVTRTEVQQLIHRYSPWLKDRFESFREHVLNGLQTLSQENRDPAAERTPARSNMCSPMSLQLTSPAISDTDRSVEEVCNAAGEQLAALASRSRAAASKLLDPPRGPRLQLHAKSSGVLRLAGGQQGTTGSLAWGTLREPLMKRNGL